MHEKCKHICTDDISHRNISCELQPTVKDHASFTDFLIWITNRVGEVRFIEVKRSDISVDLTVEADSTAQTLRAGYSSSVTSYS